MPNVKKLDLTVTEFRWVRPDYESDRPYRIVEDPKEISRWEKSFERWKEELDRKPRDDPFRRFGLVLYHSTRRTAERTMLIEEPLR